jgi:hypothetical protein
MVMSNIKGTSRRSWLTDLALERLKLISNRTNLGQTLLISQIIESGLAAIVDNDNTFNLPLKLKVV